jgi:hypothetical protein
MRPSRISRRHALQIAAGGLAITASHRGAQAQPAKRIEQLAPELDAIISTSEPILELGRGFGVGGNTEDRSGGGRRLSPVPARSARIAARPARARA